MSGVDDLEKKAYWEQYQARKSQQLKQKSVSFDPGQSEAKSAVQKMMEQTSELKRLLRQSTAENERLKQQIRQLEQTNALLSSQSQTTRGSQKPVKPTHSGLRQSQTQNQSQTASPLTVSLLSERESPAPNKYAAHFQKRREEAYLEDQLKRSKMIENELQKGQLASQAAVEAKAELARNRFDEEALPEREQLRDVIRAQARRINALEEHIRELSEVPAYKRPLVRPPARPKESLPNRVRELQTRLIELKYRGTQAALEADNGDGEVGMAAVVAFQRQLQAHVDELRAVGRELSDRAWAI